MLAPSQPERQSIPPQRDFAAVRLFGANRNEMPSTDAFCCVAAAVRFKALAILPSGSLRAIPFRTRTSSFNHGRRTGVVVFFLTAILAMSVLMSESKVRPTFSMNPQFVQDAYP